MAQPLVTIIICTRNRAQSLRHTLASINRCGLPPDMGVEAVIVDNASTDTTAEVVADAGPGPIHFRYVHEPCIGKGNAYNTGIGSACGEVLLFTDDDVRVPPNWITGMSRQLLNDAADAVQGGVRAAPHLRRQWLVEGFPCIAASTEGMRATAPSFLIGANMALSRRVLEKVPAFDPELGPGALGFGEETLYAWQLLKAGYRIRAEFDVVVEHHFDESRLAPAAIAETCRKMGRCKAYLAYHWQHTDLRAFDWIGCVRKTLAYSWKRAFRSGQWGHENPPEYWRMPAVEAAAFVAQYIQERRRTRRYLRHGLARKTQSVAYASGNEAW